MTYLAINIVLAGIPSILFLILIYKADSRKPEPKKLVLKVFIFGCLSTIPAIIIELIVSKFESFIPPSLILFFEAFIVAALCEESIKLGTMSLAVYRRKEFDEITDGIVYTAAASLGFAFFENIVYSIGEGNAIGLMLLRGITAVPLHGVCGGIMGFFIGRNKMDPGKGWIIPGLILAIIIHGIYDYLIFTGNIFLALLNVPLLTVSIIVLWRLIVRARKLDGKKGYSSGYSPDFQDDKEITNG